MLQRVGSARARLTHNLSKKFYGGGGENSFKEGRDDTAAGISSIKPFFNQEVVIVSMSIVTAWHDLDDATEEKTTHLHGKACKQTKNFF